MKRSTFSSGRVKQANSPHTSRICVDTVMRPPQWRMPSQHERVGRLGYHEAKKRRVVARVDVHVPVGRFAVTGRDGFKIQRSIEGAAGEVNGVGARTSNPVCREAALPSELLA